MTENTLSIILGIAFFLVFTIFLSLRSKKRISDQWVGSVTTVRRYEQTGSNDFPQSRVKIKWKTDEGKSGSLDLEEDVFNKYYPGIKPGDRLRKIAGQEGPVKE